MFYLVKIRTNQEHERFHGAIALDPSLRRNAMSKLMMRIASQLDSQTDAVTYLKEASALLGLLTVIYLWSLVAMALQS
jgi:predicted metal-dependent enzyme (double-stranded beta helix superfamily)